MTKPRATSEKTSSTKCVNIILCPVAPQIEENKKAIRAIAKPQKSQKFLMGGRGGDTSGCPRLYRSKNMGKVKIISKTMAPLCRHHYEYHSCSCVPGVSVGANRHHGDGRLDKLSRYLL